MRRIVHYYPDATGNSGVTHALWSWARAQAAWGAEVCVLHAPFSQPTTTASFVSKERCPGLTDESVPHRGRHRMARWPVGLDRYLGRNDLLVLHEGWVPSNFVAAGAARRARVPYIVMPHGGGNVPYQAARYRALAIMNKWEPFDDFVKRMYFDTTVYNQDAMEMLKTEDIAECVHYCLVQPARCDLIAVQIRPHLQTT